VPTDAGSPRAKLNPFRARSLSGTLPTGFVPRPTPDPGAHAADGFAITAQKGERSTVALEHSRLADAEEAERMKAFFWRERLSTLKAQLAS
jgi:hypothetical protein